MFRAKATFLGLPHAEKVLFISLLIFLAIGFFYVKCRYDSVQSAGIIGVATIYAIHDLSDEWNYKYYFIYSGKTFHGSFNHIIKQQIGDKIFVKFTQKEPAVNFMQYDDKVPECFRDSLKSNWPEIPVCK